MAFSDFFKSFCKKKKDNDAKSIRTIAERINNRPVRYVTERFDGVEEVVGRKGHINILPGGTELAVTSGIDEIFRAKIDDMSIWELLSKDGVVLEGYDLQAGRHRQIIAFYVYYR